MLLLTMEQIRSKSTTTGLIVVTSLNSLATVGVLSLLMIGGHQTDFLHTFEKVALYRTRAASSMFKLIITPAGLSKLIRFSLMHVSHSRCHTKLEPS